MKKISYYIAGLVILGVAVIGVWVYQRYFKAPAAGTLVFEVTRGDIQEIVKTRGEVVAQKEFDLEFPFSGTVERVYVEDGQNVKAGDALMKLETRDFDIEKSRLTAVITQRRAALQKLVAGATTEDIRVSQTKVANATRALSDARTALADSMQSAFTYSDDAVHNKTDQFFSNPRSVNPKLNFSMTNAQAASELEVSRVQTEATLTAFKSLIDAGGDDVLARSANARSYAAAVRTFLEKAAPAVNSVSASASISQTTLDGWRADVATARVNVDTAITAIVTAEEKFQSAQSALDLAQSEYALKTSAARTEDIDIAEAQLAESESQLAAVNEKISKSTLRSPGAANVRKVWLEPKEVFTPGKTAVSLSTAGYKIQSDISELDIGKVHDVDGNDVLIRFDAFPEQEFKGKVTFIQPKEVIKDTDVYFRTEIFLENHGEAIRSGMSADVVIKAAFKSNVLKIPEIAIYKKDGKTYVHLVPKGSDPTEKNLKEVLVQTGISDEESIEIIKGLEEGDRVAVPAE